MSPLDPPSDDLGNAFTQPSSGVKDNVQLREAILSQTIRVIRTRRRWKQLRIVAALATCYAAGMFTLPLWRAAESTRLFAAGSKVLVQPADDHAVAPSPLAAAKFSPYELLRQKGDRQLEEQGDIAAAVRTYRNALQLASADQRQLSVQGDNWLLATLKTDLLERTHDGL